MDRPRPMSAGSALRAAQLGAVAGLRSQLPLALLAAIGPDDPEADRPRPLRLLRSRPVAAVLGLSALGEILIDKLPVVPSQLAPGPLAGRLGFGGVAGAVVARDTGRSPVLGAAIGAAGAGVGAVVGAKVRAALGRATGLADRVWASAEDAVALGLGILAVREVERDRRQQPAPAPTP